MTADIIDNQQQEISASDKAFQLVSERFANARIRTQLLANVMEGYRLGGLGGDREVSEGKYERRTIA
jgi:hypothetical protein